MKAKHGTGNAACQICVVSASAWAYDLVTLIQSYSMSKLNEDVSRIPLRLYDASALTWCLQMPWKNQAKAIALGQLDGNTVILSKTIS